MIPLLHFYIIFEVLKNIIILYNNIFMSLQKNSIKSEVIKFISLMQKIKIISGQIGALAKYYDNIDLFNNIIVYELSKEFLGDSKNIFNNIHEKPRSLKKARSLSLNKISKNKKSLKNRAHSIGGKKISGGGKSDLMFFIIIILKLVTVNSSIILNGVYNHDGKSLELLQKSTLIENKKQEPSLEAPLFLKLMMDETPNSSATIVDATDVIEIPVDELGNNPYNTYGTMPLEQLQKNASNKKESPKEDKKEEEEEEEEEEQSNQIQKQEILLTSKEIPLTPQEILQRHNQQEHSIEFHGINFWQIFDLSESSKKDKQIIELINILNKQLESTTFTTQSEIESLCSSIFNNEHMKKMIKMFTTIMDINGTPTDVDFTKIDANDFLNIYDSTINSYIADKSELCFTSLPSPKLYFQDKKIILRVTNSKPINELIEELELTLNQIQKVMDDKSKYSLSNFFTNEKQILVELKLFSTEIEKLWYIVKNIKVVVNSFLNTKDNFEKIRNTALHINSYFEKAENTKYIMDVKKYFGDIEKVKLQEENLKSLKRQAELNRALDSNNIRAFYRPLEGLLSSVLSTTGDLTEQAAGEIKKSFDVVFGPIISMLLMYTLYTCTSLLSIWGGYTLLKRGTDQRALTAAPNDKVALNGKTKSWFNSILSLFRSKNIKITNVDVTRETIEAIENIPPAIQNQIAVAIQNQAVGNTPQQIISHAPPPYAPPPYGYPYSYQPPYGYPYSYQPSYGLPPPGSYPPPPPSGSYPPPPPSGSYPQISNQPLNQTLSPESQARSIDGGRKNKSYKKNKKNKRNSIKNK